MNLKKAVLLILLLIAIFIGVEVVYFLVYGELIYVFFFFALPLIAILGFIALRIAKAGIFLAKHPGAVKMYRGNYYLGFKLRHRSNKAKYAHFKDEKGFGIALLPNTSYCIQVRCITDNGHGTGIAIEYENFIAAENRTYFAYFDEASKAFSIYEESAFIIYEESMSGRRKLNLIGKEVTYRPFDVEPPPL